MYTISIRRRRPSCCRLLRTYAACLRDERAPARNVFNNIRVIITIIIIFVVMYSGGVSFNGRRRRRVRARVNDDTTRSIPDGAKIKRQRVRTARTSFHHDADAADRHSRPKYNSPRHVRFVVNYGRRLYRIFLLFFRIRDKPYRFRVPRILRTKYTRDENKSAAAHHTLTKPVRNDCGERCT